MVFIQKKKIKKLKELKITKINFNLKKKRVQLDFKPLKEDTLLTV